MIGSLNNIRWLIYSFSIKYLFFLMNYTKMRNAILYNQKKVLYLLAE